MIKLNCTLLIPTSFETNPTIPNHIRKKIYIFPVYMIVRALCPVAFEGMNNERGVEDSAEYLSRYLMSGNKLVAYLSSTCLCPRIRM